MEAELLTSFLTNRTAAAVTLGAVTVIALFALVIFYQYSRLGRRLTEYIQTVDVVIAYIEHKREPDLENTGLLANFNDYRAVLRDSSDESECFIKFKRKNLEMVNRVMPVLEFCRTSTESLPFIGILGTVCGFLLTPDILQGNFSVTTGGLILALSSTATALFFTIFIKLGFESRIMPLYFQFEGALGALESYAERYGAMHRAVRHEHNT